MPETTEQRRVSSWRRYAGSLGLFVGLALGATSYEAVAQITRSVWEGIYTEEQARRGRRAFRRECTECHGEDLRGGEAAPGLMGREFVSFWSDTSVGELFELTRETMPEESPGELSDQIYADILAYLLQANKFPAGDGQLEPAVERLLRIGISAKP